MICSAGHAPLDAFSALMKIHAQYVTTVGTWTPSDWRIYRMAQCSSPDSASINASRVSSPRTTQTTGSVCLVLTSVSGAITPLTVRNVRRGTFCRLTQVQLHRHTRASNNAQMDSTQTRRMSASDASVIARRALIITRVMPAIQGLSRSMILRCV